VKVVVDTNVFVSGVFFRNVAVIRPRDFMDDACP